jgi:replicative DNA helicase
MFNEIKGKIDRGLEGLNNGLPMGFNRLIEYLPGIQQSTYYLIGGETSSGKTAFVDNCFLYNPYNYIIGNKTNLKIKVIYYSFEIEKSIKLTKAICRQIYLDYGRLLDVNYILSRGKNRISEEDYRLAMTYSGYVDQMFDSLEIIDKPENPTGIWHHLLDYSKKVGKWEDPEKLTEYTANDPNLYTIVIVDHLGLVKNERGYTKKENIDKLSEYMILLRNKCGFIPVLISQFNRSLSSADRFRIDRVTPQLSDFKDTGNPQEDANVVMSIFSPQRYEIPEFRGYDITLLKNRYRNLSILKNRDGEADINIGLKFLGEVGYFSELPKASEMNVEDYNV